MPLTNADLAQQVTSLISRWDTYTRQLRDWLAGTPDGGPYGDGRYPLQNSLGQVFYVPCPAAQSAMVEGNAASAESFATQAAAHALAAAGAKAAAETARDLTLTYRDAAQAAKAMAEYASSEAQTAEANARYWAQQAQGTAESIDAVASEIADTADAVAADRVAAEAARVAAEAAQAAAELAAQQAATFDPALYARKNNAAFTGTFTLTRSDDAAWIELAGQGAYNLAGLLLWNPDYTRYWSVAHRTDNSFLVECYDGTNYLEALRIDPDSQSAALFDNTLWHSGNLNPASFAAASHTHGIAQITGLQDALDGKQPAGSYAAAVHTHSASDIASGTLSDDLLPSTMSGKTFTGGISAPSVAIGSQAIFLYQSNSDGSFTVRTGPTGGPYGWFAFGADGNFHVLNNGAVRGGRILGGDVSTNTSNPVCGGRNGQSNWNSAGVESFCNDGGWAVITLHRHGYSHVNLIHDGNESLYIGTDGNIGGVQLRANGEVWLGDANNRLNRRRQPRIFVQAGDPGAAAVDGDLWIW